MKKLDKYEKMYARGRFLQLSISKFGLLFTVILMFVYVSSAVPDIPMIVSGSVNVNGVPAPAGTVVTAMSGGELKGSTILTQAGTYGVMVNYTQGLVDFYVNGTKAQSINWSSVPQTLNLSVTISAVSQAAVTTATVRPAAGGASGAITTITATPKATATTTPAARATDTVKPATKTASQETNTPPNETLQKSRTAQSPGFGAIAVIFVVILISKSIIRGKK